MSRDAHERLWLVVAGIAFYAFITGVCAAGWFLDKEASRIALGLGILGSGSFVVLQISYIRKMLRK